MKLSAGLERKKQKYRLAKQAVANFASSIQEAELYWKAAKAVHSSAALDDRDEDPMELLKTKTSLGAVVDSMNLAFAELDSALLDEEPESHEPKLIETTPVDVLPAPNIVKESAKQSR